MSPRVQIEYFPISLRDDKREVTEELRASVTGTKVEKVRTGGNSTGGATSRRRIEAAEMRACACV